ncbi:ROK family protein [Candidatus Saccharibacteria bacterium CG11_big_fil_rev_8_21_14_0_20_41_19]|nr:MAG: ROK family protein [Candidatus Saccharibacteria bacterium CG2_30_41_52]PIQ70827.1 MAG: ROK family protein [Candidatus Saccharibacteria bacterium CG11_big_fil_rev_8_21_14_0_20_41_19]PIZ60734.1 MAG: ROK family protein [Candidatus Saccharibacteria bacterium CG_4_10_14_0_2_um_filter_41_11]PJC29330.1 MAG: ROK family protein [Candidatus Saccharibacteria bacterium CG_4_9_14_0_2_um_filter_41_9]PJE65751.1 MAG: ROK family protein [Candidatus Saccharibacteria bacterium CG10_big_fil_rev_8_21_14_0_1
MIVTVDTGGTKTLVASFNKEGILGQQIKFPTPKDPVQYTKMLRETIKENYAGQLVDAIVVAIPGIIKNGVAVWCNNLGWKNFDVATALAGVLGKTPIFIENDANLAGLSETRFLKTVPSQSLYVTISTGIGTGITTGGHIDAGLRHSEAGRALIEYDGIVREWESFASGQAIYKTYGKYAHDITSKRTWDQIADRISRGFLAVIPILQPDIVIIGGSIGTYFDQFDKQLQNILKEKLPSHIPCPKFVQAKYPELAVIYGCYYYAIDSLGAITTKK